MISLNISPFFKKPRTNILYQKWANYPESPILTAAYPYQCVYPIGANHVLIGSTHPFYVTDPSTYKTLRNAGTVITKTLSGGVWQLSTLNHPPFDLMVPLAEANNNVFLVDMVTVYFAKTT